MTEAKPRKYFDIDEDELEEIKRVDPLFAKYYKLFLMIQKQQTELMLKMINKYDEERTLRLMDLITRMGEEIAKSKQSSLKQQWEDAKAIIKEIMGMFIPQSQQSQPTIPSSLMLSSEKPKLEIKTEDLNV
jgi:hypothetical protein